MKKLSFLLIMVINGFLWAQEVTTSYRDRMSMDIGFYLANHNAMGGILDLTTSAVGGGAAVEYSLPMFSYIGFSGRIEGNGFIPQSSQISRWGSLVFAAGVFGNFEVLPFLTLRPELSCGGWLHIVNVPERGVQSVYLDSMFQVAPSLRIKPAAMAARGLSLEVSPLYTLLLEKADVIHLLGVRFGLFYAL